MLSVTCNNAPIVLVLVHKGNSLFTTDYNLYIVGNLRNHQFERKKISPTFKQFILDTFFFLSKTKQEKVNEPRNVERKPNLARATVSREKN